MTGKIVMNDKPEIFNVDKNGKYILQVFDYLSPDERKRIDRALNDFMNDDSRHFILMSGMNVKLVKVE